MLFWRNYIHVNIVIQRMYEPLVLNISKVTTSFPVSIIVLSGEYELCIDHCEST